MKCLICGKPIILIPSAEERAKKYGGKAKYYTLLFREHAECVIAKRNADTIQLIERMNKEKQR